MTSLTSYKNLQARFEILSHDNADYSPISYQLNKLDLFFSLKSLFTDDDCTILIPNPVPVLRDCFKAILDDQTDTGSSNRPPKADAIRKIADAVIFQFRIAGSLATLRQPSSVTSMLSCVKKGQTFTTITVNVDALFLPLFALETFTFDKLSPLFDGDELRQRMYSPSKPIHAPEKTTTAAALEDFVKQLPDLTTKIGKELRNALRGSRSYQESDFATGIDRSAPCNIESFPQVVRDRFDNAHDPKVIYIRNADLSPFPSFRTKSVAPAFEDDPDDDSYSVSSSNALPTNVYVVSTAQDIEGKPLLLRYFPIGQKSIITISGHYFDLTYDPNRINKCFSSLFPSCNGNDWWHKLEWYTRVVTYAASFGLYIPPLEAIQKQVDVSYGFTCGSTPTDDLPPWFQTRLRD